MSVNKGQEAEYKKRHDEIWPELSKQLVNAGAHNYSIFLHPDSNQLFAYVEIESEDRWNALADTEVSSTCRKARTGRSRSTLSTATVARFLEPSQIVKKWWAHMGDIMPSNADGSPKAIDATEMFHLD